MKFNQLKLNGCFEIIPNKFKDARGSFVKTYHKQLFEENGIPQTNFQEEYYSISKKGVLRGLHFQLPPHDHEKLVYCINGVVNDILFDLRKKSPTYGKSILVPLNCEKKIFSIYQKGLRMVSTLYH